MGPTKRENDRYVMQRIEDRSFWAAFDYYTRKYKLLIWALGALMLAQGFQWRTPAAIIKDLQLQITQNKQQVDAVLTPRVDSLTKKIDVLLKLRCIDKTVSDRDKILAGLNCTTLIGAQ